MVDALAGGGPSETKQLLRSSTADDTAEDFSEALGQAEDPVGSLSGSSGKSESGPRQPFRMIDILERPGGGFALPDANGNGAAAVGNMSLVINSRVAGFKERENYINSVTSMIVDHAPRDAHLTIASQGSGGVLTEHLILEGLSHTHRDVTILLIDPDYSEETSDRKPIVERLQSAIEQLKIGKEHVDVRNYSTSNQALNELQSDQALAKKLRGGSVAVLAADPPTPLIKLPEGYKSLDQPLRNSRVGDTNKVIMALPDEEASIEEIKDQIAEYNPESVYAYKSVIHLTVGDDGKPVPDAGGDVDPDLRDRITAMISQRMALEPTDAPVHEKLLHATTATSGDLSREGLQSVVYGTNDYDIGLRQLVDAFTNKTSGPIMLGKLERNEISNTVIPPNRTPSVTTPRDSHAQATKTSTAPSPEPGSSVTAPETTPEPTRTIQSPTRTLTAYPPEAAPAPKAPDETPDATRTLTLSSETLDALQPLAEHRTTPEAQGGPASIASLPAATRTAGPLQIGEAPSVAGEGPSVGDIGLSQIAVSLAQKLFGMK